MSIFPGVDLSNFDWRASRDESIEMAHQAAYHGQPSPGDPGFIGPVFQEEATSANFDSLDMTSLLTTLNLLERENVERSYEMQKELFALSQAASSAESKAAWDRYLEADNTKYQRMFADMRAAGINPLIAFSGGGMPSASTAMSPALSGSQAGVNAASAIGSNAIGKREELTKEYVGMVVGFFNNAISSAAGLLGDLLPLTNGGSSLLVKPSKTNFDATKSYKVPDYSWVKG